jgi:hypothetical protein
MADLLYKKRKVKRIPKKFMALQEDYDLTELIEDCESTRLSAAERKTLDKLYGDNEFRILLSQFLKELKQSQLIVYNLIENLDPVSFNRVKVRNGEDYFTVIFRRGLSSRIEVRCSDELFRCSPNDKKNMIYRYQ